MRRILSAGPGVALASLALLSLSGCSGSVERAFGLTREAPDEFTVETRAPLSMPPDYTLTPPTPGARRPQELTSQQQALSAIAPDAVLSSNAGPDSSGQQALVSQAGPQAPANIREQVASEGSLDQPRQSFTSQLMFWKSAPEPGAALDPVAESQRLRENAALGQPATVGNTPIIQPKKSGGFLGIF